MEFGWINVFGALIVAIILVPNIIYAIRNKGERNLCTNRMMNFIEQLGRYACIVLMWLPLFVWKFGFAHEVEFLIYMFGNGVLLLAYLIVFVMYFRERTAKRAITLAVLPACIFLLNGILLRHWLLVGSAILFAAGHIYVTKKNVEALR